MRVEKKTKTEVIKPFRLGEGNSSWWCPDQYLHCNETIKDPAGTCESRKDLIAAKEGGYQTKEGSKCRVAEWTDMETLQFLKEAKEIDLIDAFAEVQKDEVKCIMTQKYFFPKRLDLMSVVAIKVRKKNFKKLFTQFEADVWNVNCGASSNMNKILEQIKFFKEAEYYVHIEALELIDEDEFVKCVAAAKFSNGEYYELQAFEVPIKNFKEEFKQFQIGFRTYECKEFSANMQSVLKTVIEEKKPDKENAEPAGVASNGTSSKEFSANMQSVLKTGIEGQKYAEKSTLTTDAAANESDVQSTLTTDAAANESDVQSIVTAQVDAVGKSSWWKKTPVKIILLVVVLGIIGGCLYSLLADDYEPEIYDEPEIYYVV